MRDVLSSSSVPLHAPIPHPGSGLPTSSTRSFRLNSAGPQLLSYRFSHHTGPLIEPEDIEPQDGVATIPSHEEFQRLSYQGQEVLIDTHLADLEYVKFIILNAASDDPKTYFINTEAYRAHMLFASLAGIAFNPMNADGSGMFGVLVYRPELSSPNGQQGLYTFEFEPNNVFDYELIVDNVTLLLDTRNAIKSRHEKVWRI